MSKLEDLKILFNKVCNTDFSVEDMSSIPIEDKNKIVKMFDDVRAEIQRQRILELMGLKNE